MKTIYFTAIAAVAMTMASCSNKQQATEDNAATEAVVELKEVTTPAEAIESLNKQQLRRKEPDEELSH